MIDYSYQDIHIDKIARAMQRSVRVIAQQPTGAGKTWEFSKIAKRFYDKNKKSVMIIVHREELLKQAAEKIEMVTGTYPRIINADTKVSIFSPMYVCMVESLVNRLDMVHNIGLIIIDEAHIANFNKIHSIYPSMPIIGFTATPISSNKKHPMKDYYQEIIVGEQISDLIKRGSLVQNITRCPPEIANLDNVKMDRFGVDYEVKSLANEYLKQKNIINTLKNYERYCKGKKTIIFNVNIEHSRTMNDLFEARGIPTRHLASDTNHQREEILDWFHRTPDAVLQNVMIATVGFDEPSIENVITNFSTASMVKFLQCCGRGGRPAEGKKYFNILDMGGNYKRFGDWNQDRDWDRLFNHPDRPGAGLPPMKTCPDCLGLLSASKMKCDLLNEYGDICGHVFSRREIEEVDLGYAVVVTEGIDIDKMIKQNKSFDEYDVFFKIADKILYNMFNRDNIKLTDSVILRYFKAYYDKCVEWYDKTLANKPGYLKSIKDSAWHIRRANDHFYKRMNEIRKEYLSSKKLVS